MSSKRPKKIFSESDRVCAHYVSEDQLVRWVSSHEFFMKQMTWSVETVTQYWRDTMRVRRGVWPCAVPDRIRFCVSWLAGIDVTNWTARQVCHWMNYRLSRGHKFQTIMHLSWASTTDPCPVVETARPPWSRINIPSVVGRVHLPPPQFILRVETTVKDTDVPPLSPGPSPEAPAATFARSRSDVGDDKENTLL